MRRILDHIRRGSPIAVASIVCATAPASALAADALMVHAPAVGLQVAGARALPAIDDFVHDGNVSEWRGRPIDRILPADAGRPQALLWLGMASEGLVVAAEIRSGGASPEPAVLGIALADADSLLLPPLGWGHQFGFEVVTDSAGCAEREREIDTSACAAWIRRQRSFRRVLPTLFEREWRIPLSSPADIAEVRAGPAFASLPAGVRERITALEPRGRLGVLTRPIAGTDGGVGLEIVVPWSSFPPVRAPDLDALRVRVEWAADDPFAPGDPAWRLAIGPRSLARPLVHRVTPCGFGLAGMLVPGGPDRLPRAASAGAVPYMIPEGSGDLRSLIVLDNEAAGYQYDPDPAAVSPAAFRTSYEVQDIGRGERLCTPHLALARDGERVSPPDWTSTGEGGPFAALVDPRELEVRRLENGDLLALNGPRVAWSYYGSGQCGACPRVQVDVFHVSAETGEVSPSFRFSQIAEPQTGDVEIEVSDDWRTVTVFVSRTDFEREPAVTTWSATTYCAEPDDESGAIEGAWRYADCGGEDDVPEPPNRLRRRYYEVP